VSVDDIWYGDSVTDRLTRAALTAPSWLYGGVVALRNAMYDRGVLPSFAGEIPVVSVGNVTVGGTGKTPFSALLVRMLRESGHTPAVVMRGYGDDERHLHARLNVDVSVVAGADRIAGIREAAAGGADVVVLDDGFQHRRARRDLDIVLVSAERWRPTLGVLPAGPLREPLRSIRRADIVAITRKVADDADVARVRDYVAGIRRSVDAIVEAAIEPSALVEWRGGAELSLDSLGGASVLAIAGIGDPASFFAQITRAGAQVTQRQFRDHHNYSAAEARELQREADSHKYVITTEKDAVKLSRQWPANGARLWYVSQAVRLTEGSSFVATALAKLFKRATSIA